MEIQLAEPIFPMPVTIDEARQYGLVGRVDDLAARRNRNLAGFPHRFESFAFDDDGGILQRRLSRTVDQGAASNDERGRGCRSALAHSASFYLRLSWILQ